MMKRIYALSAVALLIASCQKSEIGSTYSPNLEEREVIATGYATSSDTKAYVDDEWGVY